MVPKMPWHSLPLAAEADPEVPNLLQRQRVQAAGLEIAQIFLQRIKDTLFFITALYIANIL